MDYDHRFQGTHQVKISNSWGVESNGTCTFDDGHIDHWLKPWLSKCGELLQATQTHHRCLWVPPMVRVLRH